MNIDDLTPFELFQLQRYGNILPEKKSLLDLDNEEERYRQELKTEQDFKNYFNDNE